MKWEDNNSTRLKFMKKVWALNRMLIREPFLLIHANSSRCLDNMFLCMANTFLFHARLIIWKFGFQISTTERHTCI